MKATFTYFALQATFTYFALQAALASSFITKNVPFTRIDSGTSLGSEQTDQIYLDYADKWLNQREQEQQQKQKQKVENKNDSEEIPTYEADYLAAARKRAEARTASNNSQSRDEDWQNIREKLSAIHGISNEGDWEEWEEAAQREEENDLNSFFTGDPAEGTVASDGSTNTQGFSLL